jgi:hypothetical protein
MRKWMLAFAIGWMLIFPPFASAQNELTIASLEVDLWPEYDQPKVLVINYIELSPDIPLPATIELRVPAAAQAPHVVAVGPTLDQVTDQGIQYTTEKMGRWLIISVTATGPAIHLEYYDPGLKKDGNQRSYTYEWSGNYDVETFVVSVQQPFDATNLQTTPPLADDGVYRNNLQYYRSQLQPPAAGASFLLKLSYEKPSDTLSVSRLQVEPVDVNEDTPGRISLNNYRPYLLGAVFLILAGGGFIYYWQSGGSRKVKPRRRRRSAPEEDEEEHPTGMYCAQCGARAKVGDRFCRVCGARLRHQG